MDIVVDQCGCAAQWNDDVGDVRWLDVDEQRWIGLQQLDQLGRMGMAVVVVVVVVDIRIG